MCVCAWYKWDMNTTARTRSPQGDSMRRKEDTMDSMTWREDTQAVFEEALRNEVTA